MGQKKFKLATLCFSFLFFTSLIYYCCKITLPDKDQPLLFYSNQTRQDIKRTFAKGISEAKRCIFLSIYGITDLNLLEILETKAKDAIDVEIEFDPSASLHLKNILPHVKLYPIKSKGLMHRKILLVDEETVYLGSANFTPASLKHHDNFVIGLHQRELAKFLRAPAATSFSFSVQELKGQIYLFPDPQNLGYQKLIELLQNAKKTINIAMFTLTHPEITDTLIDAKKRGVNVKIAIDYFTAKGASISTVSKLYDAGIPVYLSQGRQLLHHKWVWIDNEYLGMGSANWTKAAFSKNQDFLLFLSPLAKNQNKFMRRLWDIIETECNRMQ